MTEGDCGAGAPTPTDPYRELFERSADAILIIEDDTFVDCNQATVDMLRYHSREQVLGTHPSRLSPPLQPDGQDSFGKANAMMAAAFAKGSHRFEWDHVRADGEVFPVEVLLTAVPSAGKRVLHVVWRDITERKRLEEAVRHSQKMDALGRLAGGIAHDFNNILVAIGCNAELLAERVGGDAEALDLVGQILSASNRAAALVRQLLTFSRHQTPKIAVVDLRRATLEIEKMLRRLIGEHIHLVIRTATDPMSVRLGDGYFEQIVVNLVTNARDALDEHGTITVSLAPVTIPPPRPGDARTQLAPGHYALLEVSDDGRGMSSEVQERAFDPFFTTKDIGRGTGLGLSTVYAIATRSGGDADILSTPGAGTRVRVFLPLTGEAPHEHAAVPPASERADGGTLLVVEDQEDVARVVQRTLEAAG